jgi:hypothetical protein
MAHPKRADCAGESSDSRKLLRPTPTRRKCWRGSSSTRSRSDSAMSVTSSHEVGGEGGVQLRVRMLNSLVFSLRTTVRAVRDSFRDAAQTLSASRRITDSVSQAAHRAQTCLRRKWISWACWEQFHCDQCPEPARRDARRIGRSALRAPLHPNSADVLPSERRGAPVSFGHLANAGQT